jgi:hypothetical protein
LSLPQISQIWANGPSDTVKAPTKGKIEFESPKMGFESLSQRLKQELLPDVDSLIKKRYYQQLFFWVFASL